MASDKKQYSPVVPALKKGHNVAIPTGDGIYGRADIGLLTNLGKDIEVTTSAVEMDECGIPNAWARPLNFEAVLYRGEAEEVLRNRIRGEWRGLLAVIALRERMGFDLRCYPVDLRNPKDRFLRAMRAICPPDSHSLSPKDSSWQTANVFTYAIGGKEYPIGITSPTTLVSTAAEYTDKIVNVPWFNGRYLQDPINCIGKEDIKGLIYWLNSLKESIKGHDGVNKDILSNCLREIDLFVNGLESGLSLAHPEEKKKASDTNKSRDYTLSDKLYEKFKIGGGIYKYIAKPLKADEVPPDSSDVMIVSTKKRCKERLLFVDPELADIWGRAAKSIKVFGPYTLEGVAGMLVNDRDQRYGGCDLPADMRLKTREGIFTPKLGVVRLRGAFPASPPIKIESEKRDEAGNPIYLGNPFTPIVPLKNDLIDNFSAAEIAEKISFKVHSENRMEVITAYFSLPLKGGNFTVYKRYSTTEIVQISDIPVLEMWPDFVDRDLKWQPYYSFFAKSLGEKTFSVEPINREDAKPKEFSFEDTRNHRKPSNGSMGYGQNNYEGWIKMTTGCPDLMKVNYEGEYQGVILLRTPKTAEAKTENKWIISIDFGTTSTKIGRREGGKATAFQFCSLPFSITRSEGKKGFALPEYFLPEHADGKEGFPSMFFTIYHDFANIAKITQADTLVSSRHPDPVVFPPLLKGHTYYITTDEFDAVAPGIKANLKWGNDTELIQRFLAQLTLQCAAEAASKGVHSIEWRYSFPKAMPSYIKGSLKTIYNHITTHITKLTGIAGDDSNSIQATTEGIAAGLYFKHHYSNFGHAAVCIDIGGGTSDITIWKGKKLLLETSLRVAGRSLLLDILFKNVKVLKKLGCTDDEILMLEDLVNNKTEVEFYSQADALIKKQSEKFKLAIPTCNINKDSEVTELCDLVAIGLAGIFFYIGLSLKYLNRKQSSIVTSPGFNQGTEVLLPNMFFGGNGARLFSWAARASYDKQHKINDLFRAMLINGMEAADKSKDLNIEISDDLKCEAAYGLLYYGTGVDNAPQAPAEYEEAVFAGEVFYGSDKNECSDESLMNAETLASGLSISCKFKNLKAFIDIYNQQSKKLGMKPIDIGRASILDNVCNMTQGKLDDFSGQNPVDIPLEPVFILCLKTLILELADEWKECHK